MQFLYQVLALLAVSSIASAAPLPRDNDNPFRDIGDAIYNTVTLPAKVVVDGGVAGATSAATGVWGVGGNLWNAGSHTVDLVRGKDDDDDKKDKKNKKNKDNDDDDDDDD
ncbi:hypothetical protein FRB99_008405 [Tulasnella sp. 403]|nr:hypothetical protein FRB99_008405 [Tulasnella sp. 403]